MKMSKETRNRECIRLWTWLTKTGKDKSEWPGWKQYENPIESDCFFCEYDNHQDKTCKDCPLPLLYGAECFSTGSFIEWSYAVGEATRKKYAAKFLQEIRAAIKKEVN